MQPVPVGETGELYIGGVQVGRGYLNRNELTAETFISDPFVSEPDARLYKTGDLACFLPNGAIKYLGRIDHQVKIRGVRIELGEIESALETHPAIKQAVVLAREDKPGDKKLVAYLMVRDSGDAIGISQVRSHLGDKLPETMIPAAVLVLDEMPLNPNGKVDRRALPAPENKRPALEQSFVAPRNELERYLVQIWCDVLAIDRAGINDRFFDLGGNSLQLAQVHSQIQSLVGREFPITDLLVHTTIRSIGAFLGKDMKAERGSNAVQERARRQREAMAACKNLRR